MSFVWLWVAYAVARDPAMEISAVGLGMLLLGVPMGMACHRRSENACGWPV